MIKGIAFASVYTTDFAVAYKFYSEALGLEKQFDMGDNACFFSLSDDSGLYLQGGNKPCEHNHDTQRCGFVLSVDSAGEWHGRLKAAGVRFVHDEPLHMGDENYWFQFYDPTGNILEILGSK
ncbi:MAG: VOC family protein [Candidatus Cloacimonetes bacterium]|nr:VOC family protein [Candidatus Cloacimonadota bacterium]